MLSPDDVVAVERNLFSAARWIVRERPDMPWHRDRRKRVTAGDPRSSQALALDVFCTIDRLRSRDAVLSHLTQRIGIDERGQWELTPEALIPGQVLGEPRSTQVDVLGRASENVALFECKFTEPDGGKCSQPIRLRKGAHAGQSQCSGRYELQTDPVSGKTSRCVLSTKGIRYWEWIPRVLEIDSGSDYSPCPFAGGAYQWMRNLVAAAALAEKASLRPTFVVVYADGPFPMAKKIGSEDWRAFAASVTGYVPLRTVSYQDILEWASEAVDYSERSSIAECRSWIMGKIGAAAR